MLPPPKPAGSRQWTLASGQWAVGRSGHRFVRLWNDGIGEITDFVVSSSLADGFDLCSFRGNSKRPTQ